MLEFLTLLINLHCSLRDLMIFSLPVMSILVFLFRHSIICLWRKETCLVLERERSKDDIESCVDSLMSLLWFLFWSQDWTFPFRRHTCEIHSTPHLLFKYLPPNMHLFVWFYCVWVLQKMTPVKYHSAFSKLWHLCMYQAINKLGG